MFVRTKLCAHPVFAALGLACLCAAPGCGVVPARRLEDSRMRIVALQAENEQLRDVALNVRSQNRDMALRAVDDDRKLRALQEVNRRLEQSVLSYQEETRRMASLLDELRGEIRTATVSEPKVSLQNQFEQLKAKEPGIDVNPGELSLSIPTEQLFEPGTSKISTEGERWIEAAGRRIRTLAQSAKSENWGVELDWDPTPPAVERVSLDDPESEPDAELHWKTQKVRSRISELAGVDVDRIVVRAPSPAAQNDPVQPASGERPPRVTLRLSAASGGSPAR